VSFGTTSIIKKYQFSPNPIARQLKRNKAYRFYVLIPQREQDSGYWGQVLDDIFETVKKIRSLGIEIEIFEFDRYNSDNFQKLLTRRGPHVNTREPIAYLWRPV
jgi:LacI family transcriptional regulator